MGPCLREDLEGKWIIITDNNINNDLVLPINGEEPILKRLSGKTKITIIDHHGGKEKHRENLLEWGIDFIESPGNRLSTTRLVCNAFLPKSKYANLLSLIAQIHDNMDKQICQDSERQRFFMTVAENLQKVISLFMPQNDERGLRFLVSYIAENEKWCHEERLSMALRLFLEEYEEREPEAYTELFATYEKLFIDEKIFGIGIADPILPQKDAVRAFMNEYPEKIDGYMVVFADPVNNTLFFKHPDGNFDAEPVCSALGGGGRNGCGGFSLGNSITNKILPPSVTEETFSNFIQSLRQPIKKAIRKIEKI